MQFRLSPILWLIYRTVQGLAWLGIPIYYRRHLLIGRENLDFSAPAIIVVNHPSTLLDVLNSGVYIRQPMFFLANYGLFKHPVSNWILRRLYCIPVKRKEDVAEGEDRNNDDAFEASYQHLEIGGLLFIAAEGVSWMNRWVRPLKTGTARIAFATEKRNNWSLGLKIVPIGMSYDAPNLFRSQVMVNVGKPVVVSDWAEKYGENSENAIDALMLDLENQLKNLTIHTHDERGEKLLKQWEEIRHNDEPVDLRSEFYRSQSMLQNHLSDTSLAEKTEHYTEKLTKSGLSDRGLALCAQPKSALQQAGNFLLLIIGFPFALAGAAFWFLPAFIPWFLAKRLKLYIGYDATVKFMAGVITVPLMIYWAIKALVFLHFPVWGAVAACALLFCLGLWTEKYLDIWQGFIVKFRADQFAKKRPEMMRNLINLRAEIAAGLRK